VSLLDELRSLLLHHHAHVLDQVNQGTARLIEAHIGQLDAVAGDVDKADAEAHRVLGALYSALDAPVPSETAPAVSGPVLLGEHAPGLALPPAEPVPADIAAEAHAAVAEAEQPAPDEPQAPEAA
jgi:hypothetical protein